MWGWATRNRLGRVRDCAGRRRGAAMAPKKTGPPRTASPTPEGDGLAADGTLQAAPTGEPAAALEPAPTTPDALSCSVTSFSAPGGNMRWSRGGIRGGICSHPVTERQPPSCPSCGARSQAFAANFCAHCATPLRSTRGAASQFLASPVVPIATPVSFSNQPTIPGAPSLAGRDASGTDVLWQFGIEQQGQHLQLPPDPLAQVGDPFSFSHLQHGIDEAPSAYFSPLYEEHTPRPHVPGPGGTPGARSPIMPQSLFHDACDQRSVHFLPESQPPAPCMPTSQIWVAESSAPSTALPATLPGSGVMFQSVHQMIEYYASMPRPMQFVPTHFTWDLSQQILYPCVRLADVDRSRVLVRLENHRVAIVAADTLSSYRRETYEQWLFQYRTRMQRDTHDPRLLNPGMLSNLRDATDTLVSLKDSPLVDTSKGEFVFKRGSQSFVCGITREQLGVDDSCVRVLIAHGGQTFSVPKAALFPISSVSAASPAQANEVEAQSDVTSVTTHRSQRRRRGGDDGDDGGDSASTWSSSYSRGSTYRPKYPVKDVKKYRGDFNLKDEDVARPYTWAEHIHTHILANSIPQRHQVQFALLCVDEPIRQAFVNEKIRPEDASADWAIWALDEEEAQDAISQFAFRDFIFWLHEKFFDQAVWIQQKQVISALKQGFNESVQAWNYRFDRQWRLWYQLDPDRELSSFNAETYDKRCRYLAGLKQEIRSAVVMMSASVMGIALVSDYADEHQHALVNRSSRSTTALKHLMKFALRAEMNLREVNALIGTDSKPNFTSPAKSAWRPSHPPAPRGTFVRSNHLEEIEEAGEGSAISLNTCEELYNALSSKGILSWSRPQLKYLRSKNMCFWCAKVGHTKADCQNPPADPKRVKFDCNSLEVEEEALEHDDDFFHLLAEFSEDFGEDSKNV